MVQRIAFRDCAPEVVRAYVDSDWAGCRKTRKSTSGGVLYLGDTPVRGWSSNQAVIALSSGEAEYVLRRLKRNECAIRISIHAERYRYGGDDHPLYR